MVINTVLSKPQFTLKDFVTISSMVYKLKESYCPGLTHKTDPSWTSFDNGAWSSCYSEILKKWHFLHINYLFKTKKKWHKNTDKYLLLWLLPISETKPEDLHI